MRSNIDGCDRLQCFQINNLDRAGLRAYTFDRDEGISVVGRDRDAMKHFALRLQPGKLTPRFNLEDGDGRSVRARKSKTSCRLDFMVFR